MEEDNQKSCSKMQSKEDSSDGDGTKEDYVHVRAKRGQATNSHSLAERVSFWVVLLTLAPGSVLLCDLPLLILELMELFSAEEKKDKREDEAASRSCPRLQ